MSKLNVNDYKLRLLLFNEWKHKTSPENVIKKLNTLMGKNYVCIKTVNYFYNRFNKGDTDIFVKSSPMYISSNQRGVANCLNNSNDLNNFNNSILTIIDEKPCGKEIIVNDGIFLIDDGKMLVSIFRKNNKPFVKIRNLFGGEEKTTPLPIKSPSSKYTIISNHLLSIKNSPENDSNFLHILKINYSALKIKELKSINIPIDIPINIPIDSHYSQIVPDQLNSQRFIIFDKNNSIICQIKNDEIVVENFENVGFNKLRNMYGKRLIANKLQGFAYNNSSNNFGTNTLKLCEINLDTENWTVKNVPINLNNEENKVTVKNEWTDICSWSDQKFYGFYKMETGQDKLLVFDMETLKWVDVKLMVNKPLSIFIDKDEILTLRVGNLDKECAVYRLALKSPDKLKNLAKLTAVRVSNLYENDKYLKGIN